jgi:hypothetical protein
MWQSSKIVNTTLAQMFQPGESFFGIRRDGVPDPGVGDVDGAEEVGRRIRLQLPEEGPLRRRRAEQLGDSN